MHQQDHDFLQQAINLARESVEAGGGPFGAVVVKNGSVIGLGNNRVTLENDPTSHAEIVAIRNACRHLDDFKLEDCVLYTSCEPCPMCLAATYWARVARVVFAATKEDAAAVGFDDGFLYRQFSLSPGERSLPMSHALRSQAQDVLQYWQMKEDKIMY